MAEVDSSKDPYESPEYKCYREDLDAAKSTRLETFKIFASHSLAISGGLVAAIGYLLKEFAGFSYLWLLLASIGFAAAALVSSLFELVFSQVATIYLEQKLHKTYAEKTCDEEQIKLIYYAKWCTGLLYVIPWLIFAAILMAALFAGINLTRFEKGDCKMANQEQDMLKCIITGSSEKPKTSDSNVHQRMIVTDSAQKPKETTPTTQPNGGNQKPK